MSSSAISVDQINKSFGKRVPVLENMTFDVPRGKVTGLLGPNGSGKSTIMKIIAGLTHADSGNVTIDLGRSDSSEHAVGIDHRRASIGYLLDPEWIDTRVSILTFLRSQMLLKGISDTKKKAIDILDEYGLAHARNRNLAKVSLGMRQRVCLAVAFLNDPEIVILDEPHNGVDADGSIAFQNKLKEYISSGGTVLISSHLLNEVQQFSDYVVMIKNGRTIVQKPLDQLRTTNSVLLTVRGDIESAQRAMLNNGGHIDGVSGQTLSISGLDTATIAEVAVGNGVKIEGITKESKSLESIYLELNE